MRSSQAKLLTQPDDARWSECKRTSQVVKTVADGGRDLKTREGEIGHVFMSMVEEADLSAIPPK